MIQPNEIADVSNKVHDLLMEANARARRIDRDERIAEALGFSCDLLTRLGHTDIVLKYQQAVDDGNREALIVNRTLRHGAVELVSMDLSHFELFLNNEVNLLRQAGFNNVLVDLLVLNIREEIEALRSNQASGPLLTRTLSQMKDHVCLQTDLMARALKNNQPILDLLLGLGGIGIIAVNLIAFPLAGVDGGASCAIGGGVLVESVRTFSEEHLRFRTRGH